MDIVLEAVDSRSELLERLRVARHVLLGDEDECLREYVILHAPACEIGICSQGHGPVPSGFVDESEGGAWIGYNSKVAHVDLRSCRIDCIIELDSIFFAFLRQVHDESVIAVHELGATRMDSMGRVIWTCTTDVVTHFSDDETCLQLKTDMGEVRVDKETGATR